MINIRQLTHTLGGRVVLKDIDLCIPDHTVLGIVGINGAGKSTLLRLLAGVYLPDEGSIDYDGRSPALPEVRRDIFFLPDEPYYSAFMTPKGLFDYYAPFYPTIDLSRFEQLIALYKIDRNGKLRNFSKGMRRQVFIALALAIQPTYLLLDEAFDGLDPLSRKIFRDAIIDLVEQGRTTVLIASHSLRELEDFCDRFILIDDTSIKRQGDVAEHVNRLCKFTLAFTEEVSKSAFADLPTVSLTMQGRFVTVVLEGESASMRERLLRLSPAVMDELPLDFEESFIYDVRKEDMQL